MTHPSHILAIDQGTTSTRAMIFDAEGAPCAQAQQELAQSFPRPGWVEHDPEEIWHSVVATSRAALAEARLTAADIAGIGITNQRETTILWERVSGRPIAPAIVWQDRRTAALCERLNSAGHASMVQDKTGLVIDPYFSATKIAFLLDTVPGAREAARRGELAFGTVDCFLLWRLTGGAVHATDATNASRTLLYDIHRQDWDEGLLALFDIPRELLPAVRDSAAEFGTTTEDVLGGAVAISGMAGDQQAATIGQACFVPGAIKSTYGTGCFIVLNTGADAVRSRHRLLTTIAYRLAGVPTYALEGSIFVAGAAVQWLRDGLKIIASAGESDALARRADPAQRIYLVPAFTGLGAPWWDAAARGAIVGLTREAGAAELVRAALEAAAFQTRDLLEAMAADGALRAATLRVDGGMVASDWTMQFLADMTGIVVERPVVTETTSLGAAYLAGLATGLYGSTEALALKWRCEHRFEPVMGADERAERYAGWQDAVSRTRSVR
ncbi:MAG TPA: glycerol kinase GlpK [Stellaceae bacterium]|nr:glycerol kinase GlpK [Stellaceae bacterium]